MTPKGRWCQLGVKFSKMTSKSMGDMDGRKAWESYTMTMWKPFTGWHEIHEITTGFYIMTDWHYDFGGDYDHPLRRIRDGLHLAMGDDERGERRDLSARDFQGRSLPDKF